MASMCDQFSFQDITNHFDHTDIPVWEQDFTRIIQYLNDFHASEDLQQVFTDYPEEIFVCSNRMITKRVNAALLKIYHAKSMEEFNAGMAWNFVEETMDAFGIFLNHLFKCRSSFQIESYIGSVDRKKQRALLRWIVPKDAEKTLDRILFTVKLLDNPH
jgi:hypothetical protein